MTCIVTHPGKAHRDDFLSCCLLIAKYRITCIERREALESDLKDKDVIVVDVGQQLDPMLRNYDHHQLDREHEPFCALSAIIKHELGMDHEFRLHSWVEFTERVDSKGPYATAAHYGWNEFPFNTISPVESALLDIFSKWEVIEHEEYFFDIMKTIGEQILEHTKKYSINLEYCRGWCKDVQVDGLHGVTMLGPRELIPFVDAVQRQDYPEAAFSITFDVRGNGLALYRFDDHPSLDFSKLEKNEEVEFAHKGGFLATTKNFLLDSWEDLIRQAMR